MTRNGYITLAAIILTAVSLFAAPLTPPARAEWASVRVSLNGLETVDMYTDAEEKNAYIFLPSWADPAQCAFIVDEGTEAAVEQTPLTTGMSCEGFVPGRPYALALAGRALSLTVLKAENTASLHIDLNGISMEALDADKDLEARASVRLYRADGALDYATATGDVITGRGNTTWKQVKKPYNLKLGTKTGLLGMGRGGKWTLLANAFDETNLRNKLVLDFAGQLAPYSGFAPECAFVDLYINGGYRGLYLMCMSAKDVSRQFLTDADSYQIELTLANRVTESNSVLMLTRGVAVEIKRPDPVSPARREQVRSIVDGLQAQMAVDLGAADIRPDIESWARKLLIETVFDNYDAPNASQFFWGSLTDRTVYAGPCWDYDLSMGIYYVNWSTPRALMAFKDWNLGLDTSWYHGMWEKPEIKDRALELYRTEVRDKLAALADGGIRAEADRIASAADMDRARWPGLYVKYQRFDDAVLAVTDYLRERTAFLDEMWVEEKPYRKITMQLPNTRLLHIYVRSGEPCPDLPLPCEVSMPGEGMDAVTVWLDKKTDEPFDPETPITEDVALYAVLP